MRVTHMNGRQNVVMLLTMKPVKLISIISLFFAIKCTQALL